MVLAGRAPLLAIENPPSPLGGNANLATPPLAASRPCDEMQLKMSNFEKGKSHFAVKKTSKLPNVD